MTSVCTLPGGVTLRLAVESDDSPLRLCGVPVLGVL